MENDKQIEDGKPSEEVTIDVNALATRVEQLESSNGRLLDESKNWKEKYQGLKTSVDSEQETKLAENEQWKELLEIEKNKVHELSGKVKNLTTTSVQKDLQFKVASLAKDAYNVDDVITSISRTGLLEIDNETGSIARIEEAYNKVREEKPYLFNTSKKSGMSMGSPDGMVPRDKTVDEKIEENPNDVLAGVLKNLV